MTIITNPGIIFRVLSPNLNSFKNELFAFFSADWLICLIAAVIPVIVIETAKWVNRTRGEYY